MASTQETNSTVCVPADYFGAYYMKGAQELYLIAQGVALGGTKDNKIKRDLDFVGGLKFIVSGELDHVAGFTPYSVQTVEKGLEYPSRILPSETIIVVDGKHPLGYAVAVQFYGLG